MKKEIQFQQVIGVGCGLDVRKDTIVVTIRSSSSDYETKEFSSCTSSLTELRDWRKQQWVTHIAIQSTGIYWKPVFNPDYALGIVMRVESLIKQTLFCITPNIWG
jgi:transposase